MARGHLRGLLHARAGIGEEIERQPRARVVEFADQRQAEPQDAVDQPMLGGLKALPAQQVFRRVEIGNRSVEPARRAERLHSRRRHQPVAGVMDGIGAEALELLRRDQRAPARTCRRGGPALGFRSLAVKACLLPSWRAPFSSSSLCYLPLQPPCRAKQAAREARIEGRPVRETQVFEILSCA
jgi:hypothetical protein